MRGKEILVYLRTLRNQLPEEGKWKKKEEKGTHTKTNSKDLNQLWK
jgi:hypothetical protein